MAEEITRVNVHLAPDADPSRVARIVRDKFQEIARSGREPAEDLAARHIARNRQTHIAVLARALFRMNFREEILRRAEVDSTYSPCARSSYVFDEQELARIDHAEEVMWNASAARHQYEADAVELVAVLRSWPHPNRGDR